MNPPLLMIGSAAYNSADETFRAWGPTLAPHLGALPDGEVQDRRLWIQRLYYQVFNGHPDLEVLRRPAPIDGAEQPLPRKREEAFRFRVKPGVDKLKFGLPGWRLGYAKDAINSYNLFRALKELKILPQHTRFQVSIPTPNSACNPAVFEDSGLRAAQQGYLDATFAEVENICAQIPHDELAIQWDSSWEVTDVYGGTSLPVEGALDRNLDQYGRLSEAVPAGVQLGIHLCFGTFGGWPRFAPDDLGAAVDLSNGIIEVSRHGLEWIHIPTLDTVDPAFYAPLANLKLKGAKVYLGMIHSFDTFEARLEVARRFLPDFGLAAYCGFGRLTREEMDQIVDDHLKALQIAGFANVQPD